MMNNKPEGDMGEQSAAEYILKHGYKILERNFSCFYGEADIIAEHKGAVVFIEVKTRNGRGFGSPAEAVTASKRRSYVMIALNYQKIKKLYDTDMRFDVIEVFPGARGEEAEINHIENAFDASDFYSPRGRRY
ncbi:MAG: YraN family protein [Clostridiaceae bacterium]|jgi:putative endonuclease|nr:YraN family protein [Clostridiaceae bacterium]